MSVRERLEAAREITLDGCWRPRRYIEPHGYARMMVNGRMHYLHDLSYEAFVGPVPEGKELDHLCRNRWCFNWQHVEPVTSAENSHRGAHPNFAAQREGTCRRGHALVEGNVYRRRDGRARCRRCELDRRSAPKAGG